MSNSAKGKRKVAKWVEDSLSKKGGEKASASVEGLKDKFNLTLPSGGPSERDAYIDYALDMVVHNLVSTGQVDASKSYLLKTPEMKAHIGRMCDRVRKEQAEAGGGPTVHHPIPHLTTASRPPKSGTRWALQPNSLPITIITDKMPIGVGKGSAKSKGKSKPLSDYGKGQRTTLNKIPLLTSIKYNKLPNNYPRTSRLKKEEAKLSAKPVVPPSAAAVGQVLDPVAVSSLGSKGQTRGSNSTVGGVSSSLQRLTKTTKKGEGILKQEQPKAFRAKLDMRGFNNEEISLDMDGRKLTITGIRGKRDGVNARKATESIQIPEGINVDNLKIARRMDGILIIEETIQDSHTIL